MHGPWIWQEGRRASLLGWQGQDIVTNWVDVEDHQFEPPAAKLIFEMVIKPNNGLAPDQGVVAEAEAKSGNVLDVYEILARPAWAKVLEMKHTSQV